jgi:hypothetical protein
MSGHDHTELDARLDDAFGSMPDTDELRDLRDELRASLAARVEELEADGQGPTAAVTTAFAELGDIRAIAAEISTSAVADRDRADEAGPTGTHAPRAAELVRAHRVRPKPAFVVRTVLLSIVAAIGLTLTVLNVIGVLHWPIAASVLVVVGLLAAPIGAIVGDGLRQETTTNFPMPVRRAASYGAAAFLGLTGLGLAALFLADHERVWLIAVGAPLLVVSIAWFSYLGATQTNRKKPWMLRLARQHEVADRFSQDTDAAVRFGIYTVIIAVLTISAFIVLSLTVGLAWSWLALVVGVVVFFLVLARMLFGPNTSQSSSNTQQNVRPTNGTDHD